MLSLVLFPNCFFLKYFEIFHIQQNIYSVYGSTFCRFGGVSLPVLKTAAKAVLQLSLSSVVLMISSFLHVDVSCVHTTNVFESLL